MRALFAPATIAAAVLAVSASGLFAEAPPLLRSSEATQSSICLDFERDYADLAVLCETALTEFRHSDREMARILTNLGRSLVETDRLDEGHARLLEAAEIYPAWDRPWISIGWAFWDRNAFDDAGEAFEQALFRKTTAEALAGLSSSMRHAGHDLGRVMELVDQSLLIEPDYTWAMVEKGWTEIDIGEPETAVKTFQRVLSLDPGYDNAAYGLARSYVAADRRPEALTAISTALEIDPENAYYLAYRSLLHRTLGNARRALEDGIRALDGDPALSDAYVATARALIALGRTPEALDVLLSGRENDVSDNYFHYSYSDILADEGQFDEALSEIDKALQSPGADDRDHVMRSFILMQLFLNDEAFAATRAALALNPDNAVAYLNAAFSLLPDGSPEQIVTEISSAVDAGLSKGELNDFIAHLLSHNQIVLAARIRLELGNRQAAGNE